MATCTHLDTLNEVQPSDDGCHECLQRRALGAPADVPGVRARRVLRQLAEQARHRPLPRDRHPIVRSFEPGEDWFYCYADDLTFMLDGAGPAPSHC